MNEDKEQREPDNGAEGGRIREAPGEGSEQEEEREEVGERGIRTVPGVFRFCTRPSV